MKNNTFIALAAMMSAIALGSCVGQKGPTVEERKAAKLEQYKEQLATEQNTARVTDSLLQAIIPEINALSSEGFEYESPEYTDLGVFIPKGMESEKNVQKTYVHVSVTEYGQTQLVSTYCAKPKGEVWESKMTSFIDHTHLKVTAGDGTSCVTEVIPVGSDANYQTTIDDTRYEHVTYMCGTVQGANEGEAVKGSTDGGVLAFIADHKDDTKLYCTLMGGKREVKVTLTAKEREGLAKACKLGELLRQKVLLEQQNKTAAGKALYLQERIASKETAVNN